MTSKQKHLYKYLIELNKASDLAFTSSLPADKAQRLLSNLAEQVPDNQAEELVRYLSAFTDFYEGTDSRIAVALRALYAQCQTLGSPITGDYMQTILQELSSDFLEVRQDRVVQSLPRILTAIIDKTGKRGPDGSYYVKVGPKGHPIECRSSIVGKDQLTGGSVRLLVFLLSYLNSASGVIQAPLEDYRKLIHSGSLESARKTVLRDMAPLRQLEFTYEERRGGKWINCGTEERLCTGKALIFGGTTIIFGIAPTYVESLRNNYPVWVRRHVLALNPKSSAFYIGLYVDLQRAMNRDARRLESVFEVSTLVQVTPYIPSLEELADGSASAYQRFNKPLAVALPAVGLPCKAELPSGQVLTVFDGKHALEDLRLIPSAELNRAKIRFSHESYPDPPTRKKSSAIRK